MDTGLERLRSILRDDLDIALQYCGWLRNPAVSQAPLSQQPNLETPRDDPPDPKPSLSLRIQARRKENAEQNQSIAGASEHAARAEAPALSKPDLAALQSEALGVSSADCSFAVTGRR